MGYYLSTIRRAAEIIWQNKSIWIFGLLAGCGTTSTGIGGTSWLSSRSWTQLMGGLLFSSDPFLEDIFGESGTLFVSIFLTIVPLLVITAIPLSILGRIGIIWGINQVIKTRQETPFTEIYKNSKAFLGRVLIMNIPLILGVGMGFGYASVMLQAKYMIICMLPWFFTLLPLLWFLKVFFEIAIVTLVIEDQDIISAFKRSWQTLKTEVKDVLIMGFMLSLGEGVTSLLIGLPISLIISLALSSTIAFQWLPLSLIMYFPFALLLGSFVRGTIQSSWTLTYLRLQSQ